MHALPTTYNVLGPDQPIEAIFKNNIGASLREQVRENIGSFVDEGPIYNTFTGCRVNVYVCMDVDA